MFQHYDTDVSKVLMEHEKVAPNSSIYWELPSFLKNCPKL